MRQIRVLVVEDESEKQTDICSEVSAFFRENVSFDLCGSFGDAVRRIHSSQYDLLIIDLLLPRRVGEAPVDMSEEIVDQVSSSQLNRLTTAVAISRFEAAVSQHQSMFVKAGMFLIGYSASDDWRSCLRICMQRTVFKHVYDFVIVCALELERAAFDGVDDADFSMSGHVSVSGLDGRELKIGQYQGICILQPRMGLVDASIITTRALDAFNPSLICMAGICGGFVEEVPLGALLVSDVTWEHQAGKWRGTDFEIRSYQESLRIDTRTVLSQLIEQDPTGINLASKKFQLQVPSVKVCLCPTVSGSAVIASTEYSMQIRSQHGKVSGVDMEVYGLYRASALHGKTLHTFAAKTVVDHADEAKKSNLQQAGAILSARFVVKAIRALLSKID